MLVELRGFRIEPGKNHEEERSPAPIGRSGFLRPRLGQGIARIEGVSGCRQRELATAVAPTTSTATSLSCKSGSATPIGANGVRRAGVQRLLASAPANAASFRPTALLADRDNAFRCENLIGANNAVVERVADVDVTVAGSDNDRPSERDARLRLTQKISFSALSQEPRQVRTYFPENLSENRSAPYIEIFKRTGSPASAERSRRLPKWTKC